MQIHYTHQRIDVHRRRLRRRTIRRCITLPAKMEPPRGHFSETFRCVTHDKITRNGVEAVSRSLLHRIRLLYRENGVSADSRNFIQSK